MDFLGVGPMELFFILIIALIVMGPKDMAKTGKTLGRFLRKVALSPTWRAVQNTSKELRTLPNKLMREAALEEIRVELPDTTINPGALLPKEIPKSADPAPDFLEEWRTPPASPPEPPPSFPPTVKIGPPPQSQPSGRRQASSKPKTTPPDDPGS